MDVHLRGVCTYERGCDIPSPSVECNFQEEHDPLDYLHCIVFTTSLIKLFCRLPVHFKDATVLTVLLSFEKQQLSRIYMKSVNNQTAV